ncbi:MAG: hypothetical protein OEW39_05030 [Deltaproteobacteria bacterium]|nr:hypothetical protein [Deltaproteobacteria bacterium]
MGGAGLSTSSLYGTYLFKRTFGRVDAFAMGGLVRIDASLKVTPGTSGRKATIGPVLGSGATYPVGPLRLGGQLIILSGSKNKIQDVTVATGSNQVQLIALYAF